MEKMSRDRRKERPMPLPMDDNAAAAADAERRAKMYREEDTMTPRPDVERKAIDDARREAERMKMQEAFEAARQLGPRKYAKGGSVGSASARADGCAQRGKTKGRMI